MAMYTLKGTVLNQPVGWGEARTPTKTGNNGKV